MSDIGREKRENAVAVQGLANLKAAEENLYSGFEDLKYEKGTHHYDSRYRMILIMSGQWRTMLKVYPS